MERPEILKREIKALAFDQYGTIVDIQKGLTEAVDAVPQEKGLGRQAQQLRHLVAAHALRELDDRCALDRGHTPYRQIGHRAVSHVMDRCGSATRRTRWAGSSARSRSSKPFPDVVEALEQAAGAGYKLAILSNGDRDMLKAAGPHIGFAFDHVISVQEAGYFKPHWKTYAKAEEIIGQDRSTILFVANHAFDCIGAKSFGMRTAFIDRRKRPFGETPHQPDLVVANFAELASALA